MNGVRKFHKANGPAFAPGERWQATNGGGLTCWIVGVRPYEVAPGEKRGKWDYEVSYRYSDGRVCSKDAWCFQVRYEHVADKDI